MQAITKVLSWKKTAQRIKAQRSAAKRNTHPSVYSAELQRCKTDYLYFIETYCYIVDVQKGEWVRFVLWDAQRKALHLAHTERQILALKARQVGLSWLFISYALWLVLFRPIANVLLLSVRDAEAMELLKRLREMYDHLPEWLKSAMPVRQGVNNKHELQFVNGSMVKSLPCGTGDSYTATFVLLDEADLYDMNAALVRVKPTIDAGGKLVAISKADKTKPQSGFKRLYRAVQSGDTDAWKALFIAWHERPDRTEAWYEAVKQDIVVRTGALDELHENYPATDTEALAPKTLDKRIPSEWLAACYVEKPFTSGVVPGLRVYEPPQQGASYIVAADPAEGNPTSDDSAMTVLNAETWEEVASFAGKMEMSLFAEQIDRVATWYNEASVVVERNNHGHAVLLWFMQNSTLNVVRSEDKKRGFLTTGKTKMLLYSIAAEAARNHDFTLHTFETFLQLCSIDGSTLNAPSGEHDDRAMSFVLSLWAVSRPQVSAKM